MPSTEKKIKTHAEVCAKGGRTTVRRLGKEHMREIAKKGAKTMLKKYGKDHMSKLGKLGKKAQAKKAKESEQET